MLHFYGYTACSTCRKAKKWLTDANVDFVEHDIVTEPPSRATLVGILATGRYTLPQLFNRSGQQYRELNMKAKIKQLSTEELLDLLADNGKLIKRPIVTDGDTATVGWNDTEFDAAWRR